MKDIINPWKVVNTMKDMPRRTGEILIKSDSGRNYIAYWDARKRRLFVQAIRNHYDSQFDCRVLDGKVDGYRIKFSGDDRGMCCAWSDIPQDNDDWNY